jgi:hypothetical protein
MASAANGVRVTSVAGMREIIDVMVGPTDSSRLSFRAEPARSAGAGAREQRAE